MNKSEEFLSKVIEKAKKLGADAADAICYNSQHVSVTSRMNKIEDIGQATSNGFGLRVIIGSQKSIVSSTDMNDHSLDSLISQAISMARLAPIDPYLSLASKEELAAETEDLDIYDETIPEVNQLIDLTKEAEEAAFKNPLITNSEGASSGFNKTIITLATSNDFIKSYRSSSFSISASLIAGADQEMQVDYDFSTTRFFKDLEKAELIGRRAAENTVRKLHSKKISTRIVPVIFDPKVSKSLISNFAGAINGASIAKGVSFLKDKLNQQIFPRNLDIIDDPKILRGLASKPWDGEGFNTYKKYLVKDGILIDYFLDLSSSKQLNLPSNASATRGLSSNPMPSSSNLYLENGTIAASDLILDIKDGLYITDLFGMGINLVTGDYSQGASGFLIENGKITYPVNEITIASNLSEIFMNMIVANNLEFKYGTNAPTIMINKMTIAGS